MPDLIQLKRGPSGNLSRAKLKQGEPAYLYDAKKFCIGTTEDSDPIIFINEQDIEDLMRKLESKLQESINNDAFRISNLETVSNNLGDQVQKNNSDISNLNAELANTIKKGSIKSSDLSTAYDEDKIGLANLRREVINYINTNSGSSSDGSGNSSSEIFPGSIGFDLLAVEVVKAIQNNDYGSY